jgi:hypothetical protein
LRAELRAHTHEHRRLVRGETAVAVVKDRANLVVRLIRFAHVIEQVVERDLPQLCREQFDSERDTESASREFLQGVAPDCGVLCSDSDSDPELANSLREQHGCIAGVALGSGLEATYREHAFGRAVQGCPAGAQDEQLRAHRDEARR